MVKSNNFIDGLNGQIQAYTDRELKRLMEREGRKLKYIALKHWRKYLSSYKPKQYVRTRDTQRGIKLGRPKRMPDGTYAIELTFENSLMYHDSIFGPNQPKGHSLMLISDGWHSRKLERRIGKVYMLTYFEGTGYLYNVYKEYMKVAPQGIKLDVQWSGKYTK